MKRIAPFGLLATSILATPVATPALAQNDAYDLGTLVISGGLTPVEASEYGRAATVLTEEEIEARDAKYATDLLRALPGVSVSRAGSASGITQVRIRGHESNHTLVLIDGVEVAAPNSGEYDLGGLLAADIARIEVLRGPQSALYGSNTIGGVISITTKRATRPGTSGAWGVEAGSDGTVEGYFALRQKGEKGELNFTAARRDAGGFDISSTPGGEKDSDLNTTYTLTGRYYATDTLTFGGTLRHTDREADQDAFVFGALNSAGLVVDDLSRGFLTETFGSVFAEMSAFGGRLENRVELSFGNIERRGHDGLGNANADNTATRAKASYRGSLALDAQTLDAANHVLTFGAEWEQETYKGNQAFFGPGELVKRSRDQSALVMEYQGSFGNGFDVQGSLRHDFNDKFQDATTYALGASYAFATGTRVHASYGTGFQNPTLIEQFGFFANFTGNPNLQPEESEGWDIGIEQQILGGRGVIDVTYFDEELTNEITSVFNPVTGVSTPVNQPGKSDRKGVEVAADVALTDRLDLWLSYTWLDADDPNGTVEVRRPENEALLRLDYLMPNDRTSFNLEVQHVEGLYDFDFTFPSFGTTKIKLKDYTLVNLGMSHKITDNTRLNAGIRNLTDERYQELDGYAGPGRTVFVGVSGTF